MIAPASLPPLARACMEKKASFPMRMPIIGREAVVGGGRTKTSSAWTRLTMAKLTRFAPTSTRE